MLLCWDLLYFMILFGTRFVVERLMKQDQIEKSSTMAGFSQWTDEALHSLLS
ncbi:hypothetical protein AAHE18_11G161300 [Arachis hypogaea]